MSLSFAVKIENKIQLETVLKLNTVSDVIISRDSFGELELESLVTKIKGNGKKAYILMERISRFEDTSLSKVMRDTTNRILEIKNLDGIIIQNLDSFQYILRKINVVANKNLEVNMNYTMNCYNSITKEVLTSFYNEKRENAKEVPLTFTAPVELNIYENNDVGFDSIILYSYIDTMVTANCLKKDTIENSLKSNNLCKSRFNQDRINTYTSYIYDRKGKKVNYKTYCKYCYNKIYNTVPLYLLDKIEEIESLSKRKLKYRIDFSFENEKEVKDIILLKNPLEFTRGHYKNSIV